MCVAFGSTPKIPQAAAMESPSLLLPGFTPTPTRFSTRTPSPLLPRSSLRLRAPPRHIRLFASSSGGSNATGDGDGDGEASKIRRAMLGKVLEAYRGSNNDFRTFCQNLVDAGVVDESDVFGGGEDDLPRAFTDADRPRVEDLGMLWKLLALVAFSFVGVPKLLGYLGVAAGAHVPAWMPLVYSIASFLLGLMLVADASVSDKEWEEWMREREGELVFLDSEAVLWRVARRVPTAALAASAAGKAALRAAAAVTGLDLDPPLWAAFLVFGVFLGAPYGFFSASFDPAVEGSNLGWEEFVRNIREDVPQGPGKRKK